MNLSGVRGFFKTQLDTLKFKEWTDGFQIENIPSTVFDKAYHLAVGRIPISPTLGGQGKAYQLDHTVTLRVLRKGYRDSAKAIDDSLDSAQDIIAAICVAARALDQVGLKNVSPISIDTQPFSLSNEHAVLMVMVFKATFILGF